MREWKKLSAKGKCRRVLYCVRDLFVLRIWGDYQRGGIRGAYHWVRCHVWNRYGIIDLAKHSNGYRWGWIDRDWAMYLACFHMLCEFVENEDPKVGTRTLDDYRPSWVEDDSEWLDRDHIQAQVDADKQVRALYDWWKTERPREHAVKDYSYQRLETLDAKDEEMLQRLMKVRTCLWT